jgi:hypothetical protein
MGTTRLPGQQAPAICLAACAAAFCPTSFFLPAWVPASTCPCPPAHLPLQLLSFHEGKHMTALWRTECTAYMRRYERANKPVAAFLADIQKHQDLKEEVGVRCEGCCGVNRWNVAGRMACAQRLHFSAWRNCGDSCLFCMLSPAPSLPAQLPTSLAGAV